MSKVTPAIVPSDWDNAWYVGDEEDGCYINVGIGPGGWYITVVIDSNRRGFTDNLLSDDGPYESEEDALKAAVDASADCYHSATEDIEEAMQYVYENIVPDELAKKITAWWLHQN